jgi:hypothetical protein
MVYPGPQPEVQPTLGAYGQVVRAFVQYRELQLGSDGRRADLEENLLGATEIRT